MEFSGACVWMREKREFKMNQRFWSESLEEWTPLLMWQMTVGEQVWKKIKIISKWGVISMQLVFKSHETGNSKGESLDGEEVKD